MRKPRVLRGFLAFLLRLKTAKMRKPRVLRGFGGLSDAALNRQDAKTWCFTRFFWPSRPSRVAPGRQQPGGPGPRGRGGRGINPLPFFLGLKIYVKFRYVLRQRDLNALGQRPRRIFTDWDSIRKVCVVVVVIIRRIAKVLQFLKNPARPRPCRFVM